MNESKNLFLAAGLSIAVFMGFHFLYEKPKLEKFRAEQALLVQMTPAPAAVDKTQGSTSVAHANPAKSLAIAPETRIPLKSETIQGSLRLTGCVFDDLTLSQYNETTKADSAHITLLNSTSDKSYRVCNSWAAVNGTDVGQLPDEHTPWQIQGDQKELTPTQPLSLVWYNDKGLKFERTVSLDNNYLLTITDKVSNYSDKNVQLQPTATIERINPPASQGLFSLHEGPLGYMNTKLQEASYSDIAEEPKTYQATGGWFGFTDKYWQVSLIPDPKTLTTIQFYKQDQAYVSSFKANALTIKPSEFSTYSYHVFTGAKVLRMLDDYEEQLGIPHFDLSVDFGWFYFLTKPLFYALEFLHKILGNLGLAILLLTVAFKAMLYPMASKSFRSMARMKALQPKMQQIQSLYANDRMRLSQEMMALYKKEKVNPAGGCLPMLMQAPIFFCLYKVLLVSIEMRHAPFYGWIHDLSAPDPTNLFNLFGLLPFTPPSFLHLGILPLIMGLSMLVQQRMNPQPADPIQARMMLLMPVMFTFLFASFPAGLVLFWTWSNLLSIAQQWLITRNSSR